MLVFGTFLLKRERKKGKGVFDVPFLSISDLGCKRGSDM